MNLIQNPTSLAEFHFNTPAKDDAGTARVKVALQRQCDCDLFYWNGSAFVPDRVVFDAKATTENSDWTCAQLPPEADLEAGLYALFAAAFDAKGCPRETFVRVFKVHSALGERS